MSTQSIKIKWYNIKMYDKMNTYIWDINQKEMMNKISFWETINNWQWVLDIVLSSDTYNFNIDLYSIKVYFIIEINNTQIEEHIYTWILSTKNRRKMSEKTEKTYSFSWLFTLYSEKYNFKVNDDWDGTNSLLYDYTENNNNIFFIQDNILFSTWFTEVNVSATVTLGINPIKIVGTDTWYEAEVKYYEEEWLTPDRYIWFYKQTWRFNDGEICKIWQYDLINSIWVNTWLYTTIISYRNGDNIANYFLDYSTTNVTAAWSLQNIKVTDQKNTDLLNTLLELNAWSYYFVDKLWQIHFKAYTPTDLTKTITFDKEAIEIEDNKDDIDIVNYVIADNWTVSITVFDQISIDKYWRKELKYTDTNILDLDTLTLQANSIIQEKKEGKREVYIRCNIQKYLVNVTFKTWGKMLDIWWNVTDTWGNLKKETDWWTIFNLEIWDKINVRNVDNSNEVSDLVINRKEFDGDFLNLYLWSYNKNLYID